MHDRTARAPAGRHPLARPTSRHEAVFILGGTASRFTPALVIVRSVPRNAAALARFGTEAGDQ
jgi:hypothetical protein